MYTVTLPTVYQNIHSVSLRSIEIPLTFYTFSACAKNVTLPVTYNASAVTPVTIQDGNYEFPLKTMQTELVRTLSSAFTEGTFYVVYSTVSNKITIWADSPFELNFTKPTPADTSCGRARAFPLSTGWGLGYYLGFYQTNHTSVHDPIGYKEGTGITCQYYITGDFASVLQPNAYILMEISNLNKNDESAIEDRQMSTLNGSFAKIPANGNSGDYVFFTDTGSYPLNQHIYQPPIGKMNTLQIKFRFHDGRVIDFNGAEHSFTLEIEMLDNNFDEFSSLEFGL